MAGAGPRTGAGGPYTVSSTVSAGRRPGSARRRSASSGGGGSRHAAATAPGPARWHRTSRPSAANINTGPGAARNSASREASTSTVPIAAPSVAGRPSYLALCLAAVERDRAPRSRRPPAAPDANVIVSACTQAERTSGGGFVCSPPCMSNLPDGTAIELADGATGLDAAQAIGPRLAQAAVAVEVGGELRDLRLPLAEGDSVRILTDARPRGADGAAPLDRPRDGRGGAAPVAGHQGRDRAGDRRRLLLRLRVSRAVSADDLARIEDEMRRILSTEHPFVRERRRRQARARASLRGRGPALQAGARREPAGGRHQPVHPGRLRGPVPRPAPADDRADQGLQAAHRSPAPTGAATPTSRC